MLSRTALAKAKPTPRQHATANDASANAGDDAFASAIGGLVRSARAKRGMTRRQLAQDSGASERYLAQIEGGQGNPSIIMLKSIAQALDIPIIELLPRQNGHTAALSRILDVLGRLPPSELPAIAELIEGRAAADLAPDR